MRKKIGRDLAELCLELWVDIIESTTKVRKLLASFIGDKKLRHSIPINSPTGLECHIGDLLHCSAHFSDDFSLLSSYSFRLSVRWDIRASPILWFLFYFYPQFKKKKYCAFTSFFFLFLHPLFSIDLNYMCLILFCRR